MLIMYGRKNNKLYLFRDLSCCATGASKPALSEACDLYREVVVTIVNLSAGNVELQPLLLIYIAVELGRPT